MSATHLEFTTQISAAPEFVFDLVGDMPKYGRWLPDSPAFGGTVGVTPYPVRLGTTYLDAPPIKKPAVVTEFDPPHRIGFRHTVQIRQAVSTDVEAAIHYSFDSRDGGTFVRRELDLTINLRGLRGLLRALLLQAFRKENVRTLDCLKRYAETHAPGR